MFNQTMEIEELARTTVPANVDVVEPDSARLAFAKKAASLGIPVVALRPGTKESYKGWRSGTVDAKEIERWFHETYPGCNFGFVMGNGWACIDLDRHTPTQNGATSLRERFGEIPPTFWVQTPNGEHHYFRTSGRDYQSSIGHLGLPGVDVIGAKCYVVSPGSVLSDGQEYSARSDFNDAIQMPAEIERSLASPPEEPSVPRAGIPASSKEPEVATRSSFSEDPLSGSERDSLSRHLNRIDSSLGYEEWYRLIFAVLNTWGQNTETVSMLRDWSKQSRKWNESEFESKLRSYRPNHKDRLGLPFVAKVVSQFPVTQVVQQIPITGISEKEVERLVRYQLELTSALLRKRGCPPSDVQLAALREIAIQLVRGAYCNDGFRVAFPLETGMGKTTSVIAFCSTIMEQALQKSVLITCERIEQLAEIKADLVAAGIPLAEIGVLHSVSKYKRDVPPISLSQAPNYRFLLASHQKLRLDSTRQSYAAQLMQFQDRKRDLVVWDESLIASRGHYIDVGRLCDGINLWQGRYERKQAEGKAPLAKFRFVYTGLESFFNAAKKTMLRAKDGVIELPSLDIGDLEAEQGIRNILDNSSFENERHIDCLIQLTQFSERGSVRVHHFKDQCLLQYEDLIAEEFSRIVILDASSQIRQLAHYDRKLEVRALPQTKNYSNVNVQWIAARSSKSSFDDRLLGNHFDSFMGQLKVTMEDNRNEEGIVFCHRERKAQIEEALVLLKQKMDWRDSVPIHVLNWGQHRASNRYRGSVWTFFFGLQYLPREAVAAQILGQTGRNDYTFLDGEIDGVVRAELADTIFQAICRGNSRNVTSGVAGKQTVCLVIPQKDAFPVFDLIGQVMPGVNIERIESGFLKEKTRVNASDYLSLADGMAEYLKTQAPSMSNVSKKSINQALGVRGNHPTTRRADKHLSGLLVGWKQEGRSYVRRAHR